MAFLFLTNVFGALTLDLAAYLKKYQFLVLNQGTWTFIFVWRFTPTLLTVIQTALICNRSSVSQHMDLGVAHPVEACRQILLFPC